MTDSVRKLTDISSEEFLAAYNDPNLDNKGVVAKLNCGNWSVINVRLRSQANQLRTTMERLGGMDGTHRPLTAAEIKAKSDGGKAAKDWLAEHAPARAKGQAAAPAAEAPPAPPAGGEADPAPDEEKGREAPAATPAGAVSETGPGGAVGTAEPLGEFVFVAEMGGQKLRFRGPTVTEATNALMSKLREQNYSKIQITQASNGSAVGMNEIENGGSYKISKQLTAALAELGGAWTDAEGEFEA